MGAAFIWALPVVLRYLPESFGITLRAATVEHLTQIMIGALIIIFLIVEPHGLARLWQIGKQKLRVWPFPY
jgi:branched-chain amino acid transport system permease protein